MQLQAKYDGQELIVGRMKNGPVTIRIGTEQITIPLEKFSALAMLAMFFTHAHHDITKQILETEPTPETE